MNEDGHIEILTGFEDGEQLRCIEVPIVNVCTYLNALKTYFLATSKLCNSQLWRLHGQRSKAYKSLRVFRTNFCNVVVQENCYLKRILGFGPIAEHYRNGREHLYIYKLMVAFTHARSRIPTITFHLSKKVVVLHHPRTRRHMVIKADKPSISKTLSEVGDVSW